MCASFLREVMMFNEANKDKKNSDCKRYMKSIQKIYDDNSENETLDRIAAVGGFIYGLYTGGIPGAIAGGAVGYLIPKAVRKASRWLDK